MYTMSNKVKQYNRKHEHFVRLPKQQKKRANNDPHGKIIDTIWEKEKVKSNHLLVLDFRLECIWDLLLFLPDKK